MKTVWILWGSNESGKYIVEVYAYKITAEKSLRDCKACYDPSAHYWIQEKNVSQDLVSKG
jgi:N-acetyl-anhydromuramyl-L-alanine amidase AmpD